MKSHRPSIRIFAGLPVTLCLGCMAISCFCSEGRTNDTAKAPSVERLHDSEIGNLIAVDGLRRVLSGAAPQSASDFAELKARGVGLLVCVDGTIPNEVLAKEHGISVVHLPLGYDEVSNHVAVALGRLIHQADSKVFIHCHHGRHRGPAAAMAGCITAGLREPTDTDPVLSAAGTAKRYQGLYASVRSLKPLSTSSLDRPPSGISSAVQPAPLVDIMLKLSASMAKIDQFVATGLDRPGESKENSDDDSLLRESVQLEELLRELGRDVAWSSLTGDAIASAGRLRELVENKQNPAPEQLSRHLRDLRNRCDACHKTHRD